MGDNDTSSISAIETLSTDFGELLKTGDDISDVTFVIDGKVKLSRALLYIFLDNYSKLFNFRDSTSIELCLPREVLIFALCFSVEWKWVRLKMAIWWLKLAHYYIQSRIYNLGIFSIWNRNARHLTWSIWKTRKFYLYWSNGASIIGQRSRARSLATQSSIWFRLRLIKTFILNTVVKYFQIKQIPFRLKRFH